VIFMNSEHGMGAIDEFWQDIAEDEVVVIAMTGADARAYQRWLRSRDLHLFRIPDGDPNQLPTYGIGVREVGH
jgi:hypothetical protein